ncbi:hypothetical protein MFS40622_1062 [Methanocaldococcus sp. FS406-22]|uniref:hypothetical protein n=1 Tax=Methanocaldococcus sp. (strain FS406-22) TaxID=644281 RepID=UPI0001BF3A18|nr:hypothetical protein [Methanocaldococcus sp. FS406-22]ADC69742.1 hypothetical protein MFS40622_1062 [Methanocaldococcus sp. FS406-22]
MYQWLYPIITAVEAFLIIIFFNNPINFNFLFVNLYLRISVIFIMLLLIVISPYIVEWFLSRISCIFKNTKNDIDRYLQLLELFAGLIILLNISIFTLLVYLIWTNSTSFEVVSNILDAIYNQKSEIIAQISRLLINSYKNDLRLWMFIVYFVSSIYLAIKKPLRILNYSITEVKIIGMLYLPFMLGILFFILAGICIIKNFSFLLFFSIPVFFIMGLSGKIYNKYKKIISNYENVESLWKRLTDNQNNNFKNVIDEICAGGTTLHIFLWSSAIMLLIMSFLDSCCTIIIYIFLLSIILYLHWAVAVFFNPIQKIEEIKIIGENNGQYSLIKDAYLIEETDKEYSIIYKDFLKNKSNILKVPKDSCILKNIKTPLDEINDNENSAQ